ncbi:MAG: phosphatase [Gammaproteobacteria bacterium]|nr:MAG: phosphatase [Gammaproteobacteria bacterium]RLA20630.1 MAG: phosphatase [Gammaproteobacteria bacterium]
MNPDLHTHSTASDGTLSPTALVELARQKSVTHLALSDHDTIAGLTEAAIAAQQAGITFIPGVEISVTWQKKLFHIVGLNINQTNNELNEGLITLQSIRLKRAQLMGERLAKRKITGMFELAQQLAGEGMITRTHFARALVEKGYAPDVGAVFGSYLKPGKPGYVSTEWAALDEVIGWINGAGGVAVIAHPGRYRLSGSWMRRFLTAFKEAGGSGIEVVYGQANPLDITNSRRQALAFDLRGSIGSDFHTPENRWSRLGCLPALPEGVQPIWELFQ